MYCFPEDGGIPSKEKNMDNKESTVVYIRCAFVDFVKAEVIFLIREKRGMNILGKLVLDFEKFAGCEF